MHRALLLSTPAWVLPGASLDLDFARGRAWAGGQGASFSALLSCSRASEGLAQNTNGSWLSFPANSPRISDQGLLSELSRANLFLNSAAPATQTITLPATGSYTLTAWGTSGSATVAAGTASGTGFGTANAAVKGAQVTFNITATGTITVTVAGSPLYVQVESGTFGTSPIITGGSSATRAADNVSLIGVAAIAARNAKAARFGSSLIPAYFNFNAYLVFGNNISSITWFSSTQVGTYNGTASAETTIGSGSANGLVKVAAGFDSFGVTAVANGGNKASYAGGWPNVSDQVVCLGSNGGTASLNGYIIRAAFGPDKGQFDNITNGSNPC